MQHGSLDRLSQEALWASTCSRGGLLTVNIQHIRPCSARRHDSKPCGVMPLGSQTSCVCLYNSLAACVLALPKRSMLCPPCSVSEGLAAYRLKAVLTQIMILSRKISCARYLSPLVLDCWTKWTPRQAVSLETVRTGAGVAGFCTARGQLDTQDRSESCPDVVSWP